MVRIAVRCGHIVAYIDGCDLDMLVWGVPDKRIAGIIDSDGSVMGVSLHNRCMCVECGALIPDDESVVYVPAIDDTVCCGCVDKLLSCYGSDGDGVSKHTEYLLFERFADSCIEHGVEYAIDDDLHDFAVGTSEALVDDVQNICEDMCFMCGGISSRIEAVADIGDGKLREIDNKLLSVWRELKSISGLCRSSVNRSSVNSD